MRNILWLWNHALHDLHNIRAKVCGAVSIAWQRIFYEYFVDHILLPLARGLAAMGAETLKQIILIYVCSFESPSVRAHPHPIGENKDVISGGGGGTRGRHETDGTGTQKGANRDGERANRNREEANRDGAGSDRDEGRDGGGWDFREQEERKLRPNVFPA